MNPDYLNALGGGVLIGVAASVYWFGLGRVLGISGIVGKILSGSSPCESSGESSKAASIRYALVVGLLAGACLAPVVLGSTTLYQGIPSMSLVYVITGGLLVGFGASLGNGCTSGHGVCGISRGSVRSLVATCVFMATGMITVWLIH